MHVEVQSVAEVHVDGPCHLQQILFKMLQRICITTPHNTPLQTAHPALPGAISLHLYLHKMVQVAEVHVEGPRYWQQTLPGSFLRQGGPPGGPSVSQGAHTLYVRRKSGTMPYDEDPLGVRGLLSTTLHLVCPKASISQG